MKIILAGTPKFSANIFEEIINNLNVVAIITKPDVKTGRGQKIISSHVKELAQKYNIPVFCPNKIIDIYDDLAKIEFDVFLTVAFGQIIPEKILNLKKDAFINIHGSLLPKYRGAAPIQRAIINHEIETGFSLIYMRKKMDSGEIIFEKEIIIDKYDTSDSLFKKMEESIKQEIVNWINLFVKKEFEIKIQDESKVSFANKLTKEEAFLNEDYSQNMMDKVRGFCSNPGAFTFIENKRVKIFRLEENFIPQSLEIKAKDKILYATKYQFESKKIIDIKK